MYCNEKENLLERCLHMPCTFQTQTLLLSRFSVPRKGRKKYKISATRIGNV